MPSMQHKRFHEISPQYTAARMSQRKKTAFIHDEMKQIAIALLFLLFDRYLSNIWFIKNSEMINAVYVLSSKLCCLAVVAWSVVSYYKRHLHFGLFAGIMLVLFSLMLSTVVGNGDVRRWLSVFYPVLGQALLIIMCCDEPESTKRFVRSLAIMYFGLAVLNLGLMFYSFTMFSEDPDGSMTFFLGIENQIGYALMMGLLFCALNYYFGGSKKMFYFYFAVQAITLVMIFSGSNVVGFALVVLAMCVRPVHRFFARCKFSIFVGVYAAVFSVTIVFQDLDVLSTSAAKYVIEDVLGKNTTLTNRTEIWQEVMDDVYEKPVLGHGIRETGDLFQIIIHQGVHTGDIATLSAHNMLLQTLYEGGFIALILIFILLFKLGGYIDGMQDKRIPALFKVVMVAIFIMYMAEAPGIGILLILIQLLSVIGIVMREQSAESKRKQPQSNVGIRSMGVFELLH